MSAAFSAATKLRSFYEKLSDASFDKWTYVEDELFISTKKALVADMPFPVLMMIIDLIINKALLNYRYHYSNRIDKMLIYTLCSRLVVIEITESMQIFQVNINVSIKISVLLIKCKCMHICFFIYLVVSF